MLDYTRVKRDRRKFLALTGLTRKEFKALLPAFVEAYPQPSPREKTQAGRARKRHSGGGRHGRLSSAEQQLLFILVYQKAYRLQVVRGELCGMSQSGANQWGHRLLPVLRKALAALGGMPQRAGRKFAQAERGKNDPRDYLSEGTERRRQRPHKPEQQALPYSGKKKPHRDKNGGSVNTQSKRVGYLSPPSPGKTQDKKLAEQEQIPYSRQALLYKDTGFQGDDPQVNQTYQPKKSPAGKNCPLMTNGTLAPCRVSASESHTPLQASNEPVVSRIPFGTPSLTVPLPSGKQLQACTTYAFAIVSVASNDEPKPYF